MGGVIHCTAELGTSTDGLPCTCASLSLIAPWSLASRCDAEADAFPATHLVLFSPCPLLLQMLVHLGLSEVWLWPLMTAVFFTNARPPKMYMGLSPGKHHSCALNNNTF